MPLILNQKRYGWFINKTLKQFLKLQLYKLIFKPLLL
jgi:hypothetical protein